VREGVISRTGSGHGGVDENALVIHSYVRECGGGGAACMFDIMLVHGYRAIILSMYHGRCAPYYNDANT